MRKKCSMCGGTGKGRGRRSEMDTGPFNLECISCYGSGEVEVQDAQNGPGTSGSSSNFRGVDIPPTPEMLAWEAKQEQLRQVREFRRQHIPRFRSLGVLSIKLQESAFFHLAESRGSFFKKHLEQFDLQLMDALNRVARIRILSGTSVEDDVRKHGLWQFGEEFGMVNVEIVQRLNIDAVLVSTIREYRSTTTAYAKVVAVGVGMLPQMITKDPQNKSVPALSQQNLLSDCKEYASSGLSIDHLTTLWDDSCVLEKEQDSRFNHGDIKQSAYADLWGWRLALQQHQERHDRMRDDKIDYQIRSFTKRIAEGIGWLVENGLGVDDELFGRDRSGSDGSGPRKGLPDDKGKKAAGPPCPYCSAPLRTDKSKQCFECCTDWHDPANVMYRKRK